jgi:hypothetical protein
VDIHRKSKWCSWFQLFLFKFNVTQVNTISSEEKENSSSFFQTNCKCSMCAPRVPRHTLCRYSSSSQTPCESCSDTLHYWQTPSRFSIANAAPVLKLWIGYHFLIDLPLVASLPNLNRKCRWTLTTDSFVWKSRTQNALCSPLVAIFLNWLLEDASGSSSSDEFELWEIAFRNTQQETRNTNYISHSKSLKSGTSFWLTLYKYRSNNYANRLRWISDNQTL